MVDVPGDLTTNATIAVGSTITGEIETLGDHDWYKVTLTAGQKVTIAVTLGTLEDSYLYLRNASGTVIAENDDGGGGRGSRLVFTAPTTGTYYIDASAWVNDGADPDYTGTGSYTLSVSNYVMPTVGTLDEVAYQMTHGFFDGNFHHFDVTQGGTITVDLDGITPAGRTVALQALQQWTDIIGVNFVEQSENAQITFDDLDQGTGAFADTVHANHITTSAIVNVATYRINLHTYMHEIAHALGLGHTSNSNAGTAASVYPDDALWSNDGAAISIMSYFDNGENGYYANLGFSNVAIKTPQVADIIAMGNLYGLSTTTRVGNTTYGFNNNSGRTAFDAVLNPNVAYTIFDSGGIDTLDYSGFASNQLINLNPEAFSNIGALVGNVVIARGTVIENALGGSGNDKLFGNAAANLLNGGAGNDELDGSAGADTLTGGAGDDRIVYDVADAAAQVTGGSGTDTLVVNDIAAPWAYNLAAGGFEKAERIEHDNGASIWNLITSFFNQSWQMTAQDTRYDNGIRAWANFDVSNTENWTHVWFNYDTEGHLLTADLFRDDGAHNWVQYDASNQQNWNELYFIFDGQGRVASHDIRYDDGTRGWSNLDLDDAQSWSQSWFTYDAQGRLISQETRNDDGTRVWGAIDATDAQPWSESWYGFDAQNRMTSLEVHYDDSSRSWTGYDANASQAWSSVAYLYDPAGHLYQQVTTWDDGHTTTTVF